MRACEICDRKNVVRIVGSEINELFTFAGFEICMNVNNVYGAL